MELTKHSILRANERLNLSENSLIRLAEKALLKGLKHGEAKGRLRRYLDKLYLQNKIANNIRIYGQIIFFFKFDKLITLYQCPNEFKNHLKLKT